MTTQKRCNDFYQECNDKTKEVIKQNVDKEFFESLPKRPKVESKEDKIGICINAFPVTIPGHDLTSYEVMFDPEIDNTRMKRALILEHFKNEKDLSIIFDGRLLSCSKPLSEQQLNFKITNRAGNEYSVCLGNSNGNALDVQKANVLMKNAINNANKGSAIWKKAFFKDRQGSIVEDHGNKVRVLEGFKSTIIVSQNNSYILVDKAFRCLRTQTYFDVIKGKEPDVIRKEFQPMTVFNTITQRLEKIDEINCDLTPDTCRFMYNKENREISLREYYKLRYNKEVLNSSQPVLIQHNVKKNSNGEEVHSDAFYIPEFVNVTGLSPEIRSCRGLMKSLSTKFNSKPDEKMMALKYIVSNNISNAPGLKNWGIVIKQEPHQITGLKLKDPRLNFAGECIAPERGDWNKTIKNKKFVRPVDFNRWLLLGSPADLSKMNSFLDKFGSVAKSFGCNYNGPTIEKITNYEITDNVIDLIDKNRFDFVLLVVPNDSTYEKFKKVCEQKEIPNQCLKSATLQRNFGPVIPMMLLQIQAKMGGTPWTIDIERPFDEKTMTIGIDVISVGNDREIVTFVHSIDSGMTKYKKYMYVEKKGVHLNGFFIDRYFKEALDNYQQANNVYPEKVVIFRGSTNTGDMKNLKNGEINELLKKRDEVSPQTKIIYMTVNNKNEVKFFKRDHTIYSNPEPGTIITSDIQHEDQFLFYLVSHSPRSGTVKPSSYFVMVNELEDVQPDDLYNLTYQLCHLYYNGTNTVCFPTPLYQANKYAKMLNDSNYLGLKQKSGRGNDRGPGRFDGRRGGARREERGGYRRDEYRRDDYRRDEYRRDDHRRDEYRRDDQRRDDYRRDEYRRDDQRRDDYRRDEYRREERGGNRYDDYRRDDQRREDYRRDDRGVGRYETYRKDDSRRY